ncbi:conserved hypothetical protein [Beggiatoa sp. PS]|nr:conserved hypothetical protein [Beggiatoa sp. PS]
MTSQNLSDAQYVINGLIHFDEYKNAKTPKKYYHLSASAINLKNRKKIAEFSVWILEQDLDYTPSPFYQDSPIYLKDKRIDRLKIIIEESSIGDEADEVYYDSLDIHALVIEAETFYEQKDYQKALTLFQKAQKRPDGQLMRTYAGLYETYVKLGQKDKATKAFGQLLILSLKENNKLNIKFLFDVNSPEFIDDAGLIKEYMAWLQMIAQYFQENNQCFQIAGHCSRTGTATYNDKLSLSRALTVQKLMQAYLPDIMQRTTVVGKGFRENLVGIGTDDARDAIDRRVEILVMNCSQ